jgi:hypothetical protein
MSAPFRNATLIRRSQAQSRTAFATSPPRSTTSRPVTPCLKPIPATCRPSGVIRLQRTALKSTAHTSLSRFSRHTTPFSYVGNGEAIVTGALNAPASARRAFYRRHSRHECYSTLILLNLAISFGYRVLAWIIYGSHRNRAKGRQPPILAQEIRVKQFETISTDTIRKHVVRLPKVRGAGAELIKLVLTFVPAAFPDRTESCLWTGA